MNFATHSFELYHSFVRISEKYVHLYQHQRHILDQYQDLIVTIEAPELVTEALCLEGVLNNREREIVQYAEGTVSQCKTLLDIMVDKNYEEYTIWRKILRDNDMNPAADLLGRLIFICYYNGSWQI